MRTLYDSTNPNDIPTSAQLVAYYVDGIYAVSQASVRARFPHAVLVPISAIGTNAGIVGDIEPGCMTPAQGLAWVKMRRAAGVDPTLYCNELNGWATVRRLFQSTGVPEPHYWVANYDGVAAVPAGAVAKQYANPPMDGGHFDLSVVTDHWPGIDPITEVNMTQPEFDQLLAGNASFQDLIWRVRTLVNNDPINVGGGSDDAKGKPNGLKAELDAIKAAASSGGAPTHFTITGSAIAS